MKKKNKFHKYNIIKGKVSKYYGFILNQFLSFTALHGFGPFSTK